MTALAAASVSGPAAVAEVQATQAGPFFVGDKDARGGGPWVIQGEAPVAVKVSGADVGGRFTVIEISTPSGRGPGLHVHFAQNEWFFLLQGSLGIRCGEKKLVLNPGDSFMVPMNTPHAYVTLGTETAKMLNLFDPAGTMEDFFKQYVAILNAPGPGTAASLDALGPSHGGKTVGPPLRAADFKF
jgi:mannose-6-phosphate isomerase-like protein (cupin superfamily)